MICSRCGNQAEYHPLERYICNYCGWTGTQNDNIGNINFEDDDKKKTKKEDIH